MVRLQRAAAALHAASRNLFFPSFFAWAGSAFETARVGPILRRPGSSGALSVPARSGLNKQSESMTPTSFFLERALQFAPDYYFYPAHVTLAKTWGIVVWERWMAWDDAYWRGRQRLRYIIPQLRPKAAFFLEEARWTGFAFWVWDGLSAAPLLGDTCNLRLWIINQSNVLRDIAKCPPRWGNRRDKLSIGIEDVALLNLMWPLLNRMTLPQSVWIRWQDVLLLASCQQWFEPRSMVEADPVRRNILNRGLLREAASERAYYAALIRITWEGIRNVATEEPETTVTWPEEPEPPADNEAARRNLDAALSWCDRWHAALSAKKPGADSTRYPPGDGPHRTDKRRGDEMPAELKHLAKEILSKIPPALSAIAKPQDTVEEDDTAYVTAKTFLKKDGFPKYLSEITASLKVNPWIRRKRPVSERTGREIPNRLLIHAGDWHKFEQQKHSMVDPFEQSPSLVEASLEEVEARKDLEKARKAAGRSQN